MSIKTFLHVETPGDEPRALGFSDLRATTTYAISPILRRCIHTIYLSFLVSFCYSFENLSKAISFPAKPSLTFGTRILSTYRFLNPSENRYNCINVSLPDRFGLVGEVGLEPTVFQSNAFTVRPIRHYGYSPICTV